MIKEIKKDINSIDDLNTQEGLIAIDQVFEILDKYNNPKEYLIIDKKMFTKRLHNQLSEGYEPDCEDYWLAHIEDKANKFDDVLSEMHKYKNRCFKKQRINNKLAKQNKLLLTKLMFALSPTDHPLDDEYCNKFTQAILSNLDLTTSDIKKILKGIWEE